MVDCIFCKIIKGDISAAIIYEDEKVLAFLDIMPVNPGHTLVVPKHHAEDLLVSDIDDISACFKTVQKIGSVILEAMGANGFNIGINTKPGAGQVVFHTHIHIIPRFKEDGLKMWPQEKYKEGEMEQVRKKIVLGMES